MIFKNLIQKAGKFPKTIALAALLVAFFSFPALLKAAPEDNWLFVRQSVTWANSNSIIADEIISALKDAGLLSGAGGTTELTRNIGGVNYKIVIEIGAPACVSCTGISSSSYIGTKDFTNRFKMWRASDDLEALEMLFDDPAAIGANGILLNYRLAVVSPQNSNNENLIIESYISGASPSRKQTYSWNQAIWVAPSEKASLTTDAGRVVLEEMTINLIGGATANGLGAKIAVRTNSVTTACGTAPHYHTLAYHQKFDAPFETTALEGLALNAYPANTTLCGFDIVKFGIFDQGGFVNDNLTSLTIPTGYPDPSAVYGVQAEFDKIGTAPGGTGSYDDLQKTTLDALSLSFRSANDPPL